MSTRTDVLIVGAGPTGLTLASVLRIYGVSFRIIDRSPARTAASRAIGVSARALELLNQFGAAEPLAERGVRCSSAHFHSGARTTARISASAVRHCRFPFMLSVPQSATENVLEGALRELGAEVERGVELVELVEPAADAATVTATLRALDSGAQEKVTASWVVGADGAHSAVRKLSGIAMPTVEAPETFLIVDVFGEQRTQADVGHYYFHPDGMALIAPLPDGSFRLAATVAGDESAATTIEAIQDLFDRRTGGSIVVRELRDAGWGVASVKVRTGIAQRLRAGRCVIAGDAAHSYGPLGGQGMNGGIQDAFNLGWKLAAVCRGLAAESLLDSYERERLHGAALAMKAATSQTKLATIRPWPLRAIRDGLLGLGTSTGLLDRTLVPTLTQLSIAYPPTMLPGSDAAAGAGRRIPDSPVHATGGRRRVHDLLRGNLFTALVLGADSGDVAEMGSLFGHFAGSGLVRPVVLEHPDRSCRVHGVQTGTDIDGVVHSELGVERPTVVLVRPDARIVATRPLDAAHEFDAVLTEVLGYVPESTAAGL